MNVGAGRSDETESPVRYNTEKVQSPRRKRGFKEIVQESNTPPTKNWVPDSSAVRTAPERSLSERKRFMTLNCMAGKTAAQL